MAYYETSHPIITVYFTVVAGFIITRCTCILRFNPLLYSPPPPPPPPSNQPAGNNKYSVFSGKCFHVCIYSILSATKFYILIEGLTEN